MLSEHPFRGRWGQTYHKKREPREQAQLRSAYWRAACIPSVSSGRRRCSPWTPPRSSSWTKWRRTGSSTARPPPSHHSSATTATQITGFALKCHQSTKTALSVTPNASVSASAIQLTHEKCWSAEGEDFIMIANFHVLFYCVWQMSFTWMFTFPWNGRFLILEWTPPAKFGFRFSLVPVWISLPSLTKQVILFVVSLEILHLK